MLRGGVPSCVRFGLVAVLLAGCVPDDQTSIKPEHLSIQNPAPVSADGTVERFRKNNDQHKILLGVFDTGVDYNHPQLRDHMHFELDADGKPISAGLDFLAENDKWASHRLVETSYYEYEFLSERQKKRAIDNYKASDEWDKKIRRERMGRVCAVEHLLELDPRLGRFITPYRDLAAERGGTRHGTHVAGLMSYDNPAIGLIPYRVIPYHETEQDEADAARGKADKFVGNFEVALQHARRAGVKIVNLSLGGSFTKPTDSNDSSYEKDLEKFNNYKRLLTEGLGEIVNKYDEMLFVAAAGNDSGWSDNESRLQYPCGIEAKNVLCVAALNKDSSLAKFTNLPINQLDLVLASGVDVISTVPSDNCAYLAQQMSSVLAAGSNGTGLCKYSIEKKAWEKAPKFAEQYKSLLNTLYEFCSREREGFEEMSGTSMATPIVSRIAAEIWIETPSLKPAEVIAALKAKAQVDNRTRMTAYKLKAKMPSWYKLFNDPNSSEGNLPAIDKNLEVSSLPMFGGMIQPRSLSQASLRGWFELLVNGKPGF